MRRTYDRRRYMDRVAQIREHVPDCALTTDIIVGFPGETEADFAETLEVVEEVGYDGAFTFIFSPRRGTEAASLGEQVSHASSASAWSAWSRRSSGAPASAPAFRRPHDGGAGRGRRAAPTRPVFAGGAATTRP